ncbi:MAG: NAD(P)-binding protein, partial [Magnetococcales bacterium]|nr:NAD(P)-binding protein [Magnetococcales bacterium]
MKIIIIGAGPAGLTAGLELIRHSAHKPLILENLNDVGGISRTILYQGNRMDIGGHRFFSKSDWVMHWWQEILPLHPRPTATPEPGTESMLVRSRLSRIYFMGRFFDYPISLNLDTLQKMGLRRLIRIGIDYLRASLFPIRPERSLE